MRFFPLALTPDIDHAHHMNDAANDPSDYSNVTTAQLRAWIRELESDVGCAALGSKRREGGQRLIDKHCAELGRRGED
jgi:hypothetical protein